MQTHTPDQQPPTFPHFPQTSKQEFFTLKKNNKRVTTSLCFSSQQAQHSSKLMMDRSLDVLHHPSPSHKYKDLESTFGQEGLLMFKQRQPARKKNAANQNRSHLSPHTRIKGPKQSPGQLKHHLSSQQLRPHKQLQRAVFFKEFPQKKVQINGNCLSIGKKMNTSARDLKVNTSISEFKHSSLEFQKKGYISCRNVCLDDFFILSKLGQGTYSEVFGAIQMKSGLLVALKVLSKARMLQLGVVQNVIRQIKINMFLQHPNIAKLYTCFHDKNFVYLVCEYATDHNLFSKMNKTRPLKFRKGLQNRQVRQILDQLCGALAYIHGHNIIHRDIKPQNVLLTLGRTVKICDFGWSVYNPGGELRSTLCGTPLYLAPQIISQANYDQTVDIWAVGVLTYEMLTQQNPFRITHIRDIKKIVWADVCFESLRDKNAIDFVTKALEKNPQNRTSIAQLKSHAFLRGPL